MPSLGRVYMVLIMTRYIADNRTVIRPADFENSAELLTSCVGGRYGISPEHQCNQFQITQ